MRSSPEIYHGEEPASSDDDVRDDIAHIGQEKKMDHSPILLCILGGKTKEKRSCF